MRRAAARVGVVMMTLGEAAESRSVYARWRARRRIASLVARGMSEAEAMRQPLTRGRPPAIGAIDQVTPYERDLRCRVIVREHPDGLSRESVGALLGISGERVRQIEESALRAVEAQCQALGISGADLWAALASRGGEEHTADGRGGPQKGRMGVGDWRETGEPLPVGPYSEHGLRVEAAIVELERVVARLEAR